MYQLIVQFSWFWLLTHLGTAVANETPKRAINVTELILTRCM
jgi:hypothetical protein